VFWSVLSSESEFETVIGCSCVEFFQVLDSFYTQKNGAYFSSSFSLVVYKHSSDSRALKEKSLWKTQQRIAIKGSENLKMLLTSVRMLSVASNHAILIHIIESHIVHIRLKTVAHGNSYFMNSLAALCDFRFISFCTIVSDLKLDAITLHVFSSKFLSSCHIIVRWPEFK
jgi:hypothetical protein